MPCSTRERGGIRLLARRRGADVRIEVWDTGPGIAPADREMIFEEFQRGPAADRAAIGGFGLGLSIVQRMAEALGHPIDLCSRLGHGTRFSLIAPWAGNVDARARAPAPVRCAQSYGLGGAKVVVIDNDVAVLEAMQALLERWTCEVRLVRNLDEIRALTENDGFRPDIILADYHLDGGACGLAAVDALRNAAGAPIPAVVITADRAASIGERGARARLRGAAETGEAGGAARPDAAPRGERGRCRAVRHRRPIRTSRDRAARRV